MNIETICSAMLVGFVCQVSGGENYHQHGDIIIKGEIESCFANCHFDDVLIESLIFLAYCFYLCILDLELVKTP